MTPLRWEVQIDWSGAIASTERAAQAIEQRLSRIPATPGGGASAEREADRQVAAQERAAQAAERAAARQQAAVDRAATAAERAASRAQVAEDRLRRQEAADTNRAIDEANRRAAAEEKAREKAIQAAERQASAQRDLNELAAGTNEEKVNAALERRIAKIEALRRATGDDAAAERALARARQEAATELEQLNRAENASVDGSNRAASAAGMLGQQLTDVAIQAQMGTSPFTILIQQGPQIAAAFEQGGGAAVVLKTVLDGLTKAFLANGLVLGTLTAAVAAAALVYRAMSLEADRMIERRKLEKDVAESLIPAERALRDARVDQDEATGKLSKTEADLLRIRNQAQDQVAEYTAQQQAKIAAIEEETAAQQKYLNVQRGIAAELGVVLTLLNPATAGRIAQGEKLRDIARENVLAMNEEIDSITGLEAAHDEAKDKINVYNDAIQRNADLTQEARKAQEEAKKADDAAANSKREHAKAVKEDMEWLRRLNAQMEEEARIAAENQQNYRDATNGLDALGREAMRRTEREKTASQQVVEEYEQQKAKIKELLLQATTAAETKEARDNALLEAERANNAAREAMSQRLSQIREQAAIDGLRLQVETEEKQRAIIEKGAKDADEIAKRTANATANATVKLALSVTQIITDAANQALQKESDAVQQAAAKVSRIQDLIGKLSDETVDAATLSGKALLKAYKSGEVAADSLSKAQKKELERRLQEQENAAKKEEAQHKRAALQAFKIQQATSAVSVAILTAQAIVNALATLPYPAAPVAAAAAAATGAAQEVAILTAEPPSFRGGGLVASDAPTAAPMPDSRLIAAEIGEAILTRQGTQAVGGEEGVRRINSGTPPGPLHVNLKLGRQTMQTVIVDLARRPGAYRGSTVATKHRTNPYLTRGG